MYHGPPGLPPTDPELIARHSRFRTFFERFEGALIALGAAIGLLVVVSIIGWIL